MSPEAVLQTIFTPVLVVPRAPVWVQKAPAVTPLAMLGLGLALWLALVLVPGLALWVAVALCEAVAELEEIARLALAEVGAEVEVSVGAPVVKLLEMMEVAGVLGALGTTVEVLPLHPARAIPATAASPT